MRFLRTLLFFLIMIPMLAMPRLRAEEGASGQEEALLKQIEELKDLRARDPEAYLKTIQEKRAHLKQEFQAFREKDPERFHQFLQDRQEVKRKRLAYFKERHPQAFRYFAARRMERVHNMAQAHPERFQEFLANHPQFQERYQNYVQKQNPPGPEGPRPYGNQGPRKRPLMQRLDQMQNQNPEGFQQMMEKRPRLQRRYGRYQEQRQDRNSR